MDNHEHKSETKQKDDVETVDEGMSDGAEKSLPQSVIDEAERLTRLCVNATVDAEITVYRDQRQSLLDEYGYTARIRDADDTLVLYPQSWLTDGIAQFNQIDDTNRAVEVSLSGPAVEADWEDVETTNKTIIDTIRQEHGEAHAKNIRAFADFMGNYYLKTVTEATKDERKEFINEYYTRNAWPSEQEEAIVSKSIKLLDTIEG
ncbi:rnhA operon protein [Haloquadratum walsbyi]|jgi:hypothetical protein|nr:rnhA operon protein [Haloquadratum walsbyi]